MRHYDGREYQSHPPQRNLPPVPQPIPTPVAHSILLPPVLHAVLPPRPPPGYNDGYYESRDYYSPDLYRRPVYREEIPQYPDGRTVSSDMYKAINRPARHEYTNYTNLQPKEQYRYYPQVTEERRSEYVKQVNQYPVGMVRSYVESYNQGYPNGYTQADAERIFGPVRVSPPMERRNPVRKCCGSTSQTSFQNPAKKISSASQVSFQNPAKTKCCGITSQMSLQNPAKRKCCNSTSQTSIQNPVRKKSSSSQTSVNEKKKCCGKQTRTISVSTDTEKRPILKIIKMKESPMDTQVKYKTFWAPEKIKKVNKGASTDSEMSKNMHKYTTKTENQLQKNENILVQGGGSGMKSPLIKTIIIPTQHKPKPKPKSDKTMQTDNSFLLKSCIKKNKDLNEKQVKMEAMLGKVQDSSIFKKQNIIKNKDKETETNRLFTETRSIQTSSTGIKKETPKILTPDKKSSLSIVEITSSVTSFSIKNPVENYISKDSNCLKDLTEKDEKSPKPVETPCKSEGSVHSLENIKKVKSQILMRKILRDAQIFGTGENPSDVKSESQSFKEDQIQKVKSKTKLRQTKEAPKTDRKAKLKRSASYPDVKCATPCSDSTEISTHTKHKSKNSPEIPLSSYTNHRSNSPEISKLTSSTKHSSAPRRSENSPEISEHSSYTKHLKPVKSKHSPEISIYAKNRSASPSISENSSYTKHGVRKSKNSPEISSNTNHMSSVARRSENSPEISSYPKNRSASPAISEHSSYTKHGARKSKNSPEISSNTKHMSSVARRSENSPEISSYPKNRSDTSPAISEHSSYTKHGTRMIGNSPEIPERINYTKDMNPGARKIKNLPEISNNTKHMSSVARRSKNSPEISERSNYTKDMKPGARRSINSPISNYPKHRRDDSPEISERSGYTKRTNPGARLIGNSPQISVHSSCSKPTSDNIPEIDSLRYTKHMSGAARRSLNSPEISERSSYTKHMSPAARRLSSLPKRFEKRSVYKCGTLRPECEKPHNWQCFVMHEQLDSTARFKCAEIPNKIEEELTHLKNQLSQLRDQWADYKGGSGAQKVKRRMKSVQVDPGDWIVMS